MSAQMIVMKKRSLYQHQVLHPGEVQGSYLLRSVICNATFLIAYWLLKVSFSLLIVSFFRYWDVFVYFSFLMALFRQVCEEAPTSEKVANKEAIDVDDDNWLNSPLTVAKPEMPRQFHLPGNNTLFKLRWYSSYKSYLLLSVGGRKKRCSCKSTSLPWGVYDFVSNLVKNWVPSFLYYCHTVL